MEKYPCANALNMRLGSLIKDIDMDKPLWLVYEIISNERSGAKFVKIMNLSDSKPNTRLSFADNNGFYPCYLVVSY
jgi:hypothetical protein